LSSLVKRIEKLKAIQQVSENEAQKKYNAKQLNKSLIEENAV
jgi:hypothetical protein